MYNIRYNVLNKVHEARRAAAVEDPVELLSPRRRPRACPRLAKGITGRRASGHWKGFVTRAMAMARWDAIVPSHGTRTMGNSDRFANKANGSCSPLSPQESSVALHGFIKKTRKTPDQDLELARKRKEELE